MNLYQTDYFNEEIFSTDYDALANAIFSIYKPKEIAEFGCGPGHLTRALAKLGVGIVALDGFASPDFNGYSDVKFYKMDLNDGTLLSEFLKGKQFDMAICTEVAEHLQPSSSEHLIKCLTSCAPIVIFSAAVPGQGGHGHINCADRGFWHQLFVKYNFKVVDSLRKKLRDNAGLAIWYKLNVLDYISTERETIKEVDVIKNLIDSESYSSSLFYKIDNENSINQAYLKYPVVKQYFQFRRFLKAILKK
jgi:SAM-dependent methyltransferase